MELLSLIDLGRTDEAERRAQARMPEAVNDYHGQTTLWWIRSEAALWGGHPRRALGYLEKFMDGPEGDPNRGFGLSTLAWAQWESGLPVTDRIPVQTRPLMAGVEPEAVGVQLLAGADFDGAAAYFDRAAALWAPYHRRGDFRCRWARGEALRRAGDDATAVAVLEQVEADASALDHHMIVGRIRRSLRQLGIRRTAERSASAGDLLSGREREVLDLAGQGLTNAQIGARLGISRRTVASLVETAVAKLGASSRSHAVALAGGR
jgi:DNA-binding CsgD family transcriptional regulator